nr:hypothetical protein [Arthrobacter alpinus]
MPTIRRIVTRDLKQAADGRRRALAAASRIIDRAGLRVGGASCAEENGSFGVATLQRRHVIAHDHGVEPSFRGKSGGDWGVQIPDGLLGDHHAFIPRYPRAGPALSVEIHEGRCKFWEPITDTEINTYLGNIAGQGFTAKDFRTCQGTVVAAISLARSRQSELSSAEAVVAAVDTAATWLHNTPSIARSS